MSTVAEIEAAIEQLPPEEFRTLKEWIVRRPEKAGGRMWSPAELGAAEAEMVAETDPERAKAIQARIVAGFYGDADASHRDE